MLCWASWAQWLEDGCSVSLERAASGGLNLYSLLVAVIGAVAVLHDSNLQPLD
jgi:uncharacterized membrane protein YeaQ/YmgE (transglycosylase-associated protein family)